MRTPTSTYRLQITPTFTLHDAASRLEYLHDLGVDWVYLSPILAAVPGSEHGYDVIDHGRIDPARGGADGLATLSREARRLGMGILVDIVPNHMGVALPHENAAWWDLLRLGRKSSYAEWFDVDWDAGDGRLRIPVVGDDDLGADGAIDNLTIVDDELRYHDNRYPIAPGTGEGTPQQVHDRQHYELIGWRRADHDLNYRRFFGINTLAAVRVEDPAVFDATHREVGRWFDEGLVDGLRIDHPDGLRDPAGYLERLRERIGGAFIVVEKILEPGERLEPWACEGTTGYDTLGVIDRVLTDPDGEGPLGDVDTHLRGGEAIEWHDLIHDTKRAIADHTLGSEVHRIGREIVGQLQQPPSEQIDDALAELLACFPVYRSYLPSGETHLRAAEQEARRRRPELGDQLDQVMPILGDPQNPAALRFQQTSGMVMAKGVEDTAFYRYPRLTSLNEVGGDPSIFSMDVEEFHREMRHRQQEWPDAMNALSTHDTKRSEDVRARMTTLAQFPDRWRAVIDHLEHEFPEGDKAFGNLVLQAVYGSWSHDGNTADRADRLAEYAVKAAREASIITTWTANDAEVEIQLRRLATDAASDDRIGRLVVETNRAWASNVLAAKLLSITIPGFPDLYQGSEQVGDSLVDPDNRRPVEWPADTNPPAHPAAADLGALKTHVVREALRLRRDRPELFTRYEALRASGEKGHHVLAFDRGGSITVVGRFSSAVDSWGATEIAIPPGNWRDLVSHRTFSGGQVDVAELFDEHPVALLVAEDS